MSIVPRRNVPLILWLIGAAIVATHARAARLSIRQHTTASGLPHDGVIRIVPDSRGCLWFCTGSGLSGFGCTAAPSRAA